MCVSLWTVGETVDLSRFLAAIFPSEYGCTSSPVFGCGSCSDLEGGCRCRVWRQRVEEDDAGDDDVVGVRIKPAGRAMQSLAALEFLKAGEARVTKQDLHGSTVAWIRTGE